MEVHPPHHPVNTLRESLVHIGLMTIGLFIALMLEAGVEWLHHRHLLHTADHNLRTEREINRKLIAEDERQLDGTEQRLRTSLTLIAHLKTHQPDSAKFDTHWEFSAPENAAWDTARNSGASALMSYDDAEAFSTVYSQQDVVIEDVKLYMQAIYRIRAPLHDSRGIGDLAPAELDDVSTRIQDALSALEMLRDSCRSLDNVYNAAPI